MRKTKIVATVGPACDAPGVLENMIEAGVNIFRVNFSHGSIKDHERRIKAVRQAAAKLGAFISIFQDLSGPKIRVGQLSPSVIELASGDKITLTARNLIGNRKLLPVNYKGLARDVQKGSLLFLADGLLEIEVLNISGTDLLCRVLNSGKLASHQGINFPGGTLRPQILTAKDKVDAKNGVRLGIDVVALSFVRSAADIRLARRFLKSIGAGRMPIIAKIEKHEALKNLDEILQESNGVMVARGDLGVEIPIEHLPLAQKIVIRKARAACKPVIVATHMLASMVNRPRPSRAEVTDITNAVLDGTDAIMLSEETAVGQYPVEAVKVMAAVARAAEDSINHERFMTETPVGNTTSDAISQAACRIAKDIGARVIITPTAYGNTSRKVSRFRPAQSIVALSHHPEVLKLLNFHWGVHPFEMSRAKDLDQLFEVCLRKAREGGFLKKGARAVITAGVPLNVTGATNLIKVYAVNGRGR